MSGSVDIPAAPALVASADRARAGAQGRLERAWITGAFAVMAIVIALIRFRCSPLYPRFADINSDVYVYQLVGNSWRYGLLPYRDVYDVKGPFFFLLFRLFALLAPWSMGPPLVCLALLAFVSLRLAYGIARLRVPGPAPASVAALGSVVVIYLGVADVPTSFTCEELAVPGVLLLLWLVLRWMVEPTSVRGSWWVGNGVVSAALFWTKYQVVVPWIAVLIALAIGVICRRVAGRLLVRPLLLTTAGAVVATAFILGAYAEVLPSLFSAYFAAKTGTLGVGTELTAEARFTGSIAVHNTAAGLVVGAVALTFLVEAVRRRRWRGAFLCVAMSLSLWGSVALVRHPNNLFVPLCFAAVAAPELVHRLWRRWGVGPTAGVTATLVALVCAAPLGQSVTSDQLLGRGAARECVDLPSRARRSAPSSLAATFAEVAGNHPILSLGMLAGVRSAYIAKLPSVRRFAFVDASWATRVGADRVQAGYLQNRTFDYVWIHIPGLDPYGDLPGQIAHTVYTHGRSQPDQAAALVADYRPVVACVNNLLLRARP